MAQGRNTVPLAKRQPYRKTRSLIAMNAKEEHLRLFWETGKYLNVLPYAIHNTRAIHMESAPSNGTLLLRLQGQ